MMKSMIHMGAVVLLAVAVTSCAVFQSKSDEDLVCDLMVQLDTAMKAGDVEDVMALYSEDYEGRNGSTRDDMRERLERWLPRMKEAAESGRWRTDMSQAVAAVDGDTATFGPVIRQGRQRTMTSQYILKKETDGIWRIVGTERLQTE